MTDISILIEDMLAYKESLGFSRRTYEGWLRDFASYFTKEGIQEFSADSTPRGLPNGIQKVTAASESAQPS